MIFLVGFRKRKATKSKRFEPKARRFCVRIILTLTFERLTFIKCREQFLPPIDPDNEQFVIYVRSKKGLKTWFPLNVVTGGSTANTLVKGLDSNLSKDMALKSLTNNIGQALYKEQVQLEEMVRKMPMLKSARELEYGFSVLDKENPNSMFKPSEKDVYVIPPEEETRMPAQEAAEGLKKIGDNFKKLIDGGN
ncbi:unnamed protein product [Bathycoccus prasinos]